MHSFIARQSTMCLLACGWCAKMHLWSDKISEFIDLLFFRLPTNWLRRPQSVSPLGDVSRAILWMNIVNSMQIARREQQDSQHFIAKCRFIYSPAHRIFLSILPFACHLRTAKSLSCILHPLKFIERFVFCSLSTESESHFARVSFVRHLVWSRLFNEGNILSRVQFVVFAYVAKHAQ